MLWATIFTLFLADKAGFWRRDLGPKAQMTEPHGPRSATVQPLGLAAHPVLRELPRRLRSPARGCIPGSYNSGLTSRVSAAVRGILRRPAPCSVTGCYGVNVRIQSP